MMGDFELQIPVQTFFQLDVQSHPIILFVNVDKKIKVTLLLLVF